MGRQNQNEFAKRQRTMKKKEKAEAKQARRVKKKQDSNIDGMSKESQHNASNPTADSNVTTEDESGNDHAI